MKQAHEENFLKRLDKLNEKQKEAVETLQGPVLVVAGPGTGKTEILGMRVAKILYTLDVQAENILVTTFTESGVQALKNRLLEILGPESYKVNVCTFHGFCNEVIGSFTEKFIFAKKLEQLDDIEKIEILKEILDKEKPENLTSFGNKYFYLREILKAISDLKREAVNPLDFAELVKQERKDFEENLTFNKKTGERLKKWDSVEKKIFRNEELQKIYTLYEERLKKDGKYDFEDMILFVVKKLEEDDELLAYYQEKYQYLLVDEYQDTNSAQNKVVELLASFDESPNVFTVGDDDQSIYRFQGASVENLLYFEKKFKDLKKIVLNQNYRSTQKILDAAYSCVEKNQQRVSNLDPEISKEIKSNTGDGEKIQIYQLSDSDGEKIFLLKEIKKLLEKGVNASEIAVFTRTNFQIDEVANFLIKNEIAVNFEGGENLFRDKRMQILLDYLRIVEDPFDDEKFFYTASLSLTGINQIDLFKITKYLSNLNKGLKWKKTYFDLLSNESELEKIDLKNKEKITDFIEKLARLKQLLAENTLSRFFEIFLKETNFLDFLAEEKAGLKLLNKVNTLFNKLKKLNRTYKDLKLKRFLEILENYEEFGIKIGEEQLSGEKDGVNLMTAHKSKGLEFEYCFVFSCVDGVWGNRRSFEKIALPNLAKNESLIDKNEEERRLFFVALTRAKKKITVTYSELVKSDFGDKKTVASQFLSEISDELKNSNEKLVQIEEQENFFLKNFSPVNEALRQGEEEFLREQLKNFKLSFTSFWTYLECPKRFKERFLLKFPETKNKHAVLGSCFHKALENYFLEFKKSGNLLSENEICKFFDQALEREVVTLEEKEEIQKIGHEGLKGYLEFYKGDFLKPVGLEQNFGSKNLQLEEVVLTGVIDKIEEVGKSESGKKLIRIVDYKTGRAKSENEINGKTENSDGRLRKQLIFYKVLTELDSDFRKNYDAIEGELDFVEGKDGNYKKVRVAFEESEVEEMKKEIREVWGQIQDLKFEGCGERLCETCN